MASNLNVERNGTVSKIGIPDIYRKNAFQVLNLPVTASTKEISSRIRKLELESKYGTSFESSVQQSLINIPRDEINKRDALLRIKDPQLRFIDEFFWFWPLSFDSDADDEALKAIMDGDISTAESIWNSRELQDSESHVSTHNLAVLNHAMALELEFAEKENQITEAQIQVKRIYWRKSFDRWLRLLDNQGYWDRVQQRILLMADPRLRNTLDLMKDSLDVAILSINGHLVRESIEMNDQRDALFHLELIRESGFDTHIIREAIRRAMVPVREQIKTICTSPSNKSTSLPETNLTSAQEIIDDTKPLLSAMDLVFIGEDDDAVNSAHDEVALAARSHLLAYCNETADWRNALELSHELVEIAASPSVKQKLQEDIEIIDTNMKYSTCWFCGENQAEEYSMLQVPMYGDVQKDHSIFTGTTTHYRKLSVPVPRCPKCQSAHSTRHNIGCFGAIGSLIIGVFVGIATQNFIPGLAIFGAGWLIAYVISLLVFPQGIKPESHQKEFTAVREMLARGWEIGDKPS